MKRTILHLSAVAFVLGLAACASEESRMRAALDGFSAQNFAQDVKVLASDEYEGRGPASKGEEKTIAFLEQEFTKIGLKPGNGSSFVQEIPMVEIAGQPGAALEVKGKKKTLSFAVGDEFVVRTQRVAETISVADSDVIFAGYGIVAPEYNWNDFEGVDVKGKTIIVLVNDPGYASGDPALFTGKAMTYYGRWVYKYEEAARQGAAGVFIVHETAPAAYGWNVVQTGWTGPRFNLLSPDNNMSRCAAEGWLHLDAARKIFEAAGMKYEELRDAAAKRGFKPVALGLKAGLTLKNSVRNVVSRNFIAQWPGSQAPGECVIYMAHWDHFGINPALQGDQIFNGAVDNATGTAALIELARAFKAMGKTPRRSVVFLSVTGEEQGLIGSEYYAAHPVFPTAKTVAAINIDAMNTYGAMKDITVIGYGLSELDGYIEAAAKEQGRTVNPDPTPEHGSYFRSDHFPFAKQGIPAVYPAAGTDSVEHGRAWTLAQRAKFLAEKYHKVTDEYDPNWDLSGAVDDLRLLFKVGYQLASETAFPNWKEGTEYKKIRDADLKR